MLVTVMIFVFASFNLANGKYIEKSDENYYCVCYFTNWGQYRPGAGRYMPNQVDPFLCTHVIYAFARITDGQVAPYEWDDDKLYHETQALKNINPKLKTLLSIGGWNHDKYTSPFSKMVRTAKSRKIFIISVLKYVRKYGFDGVDLDWEYPAGRGDSPPEDKYRYTFLCSEMRAAIEKEASQTGKPRLLFTAAVPAGVKNIDAGYEVPKIMKLLDWVNLMTYDLHGSWDGETGIHTALVGSSNFTVTFVLDYWMKLGASPSQIALGLASYGRSFTLQDPSDHGIGAPTTGPGNVGKYTGEAGFLAYFEICRLPFNIVEDDVNMTPYGYYGNQWIGFDNTESIALKVDLIKKHRLLGAMVWSLDLDDFNELCSGTRYPILKAINAGLQGYDRI